MDDVPEFRDLLRQVQAIEPVARLVPLRVLRRAIRLSRDRGDFHTSVVHDRCWRVNRNRLFDLVFPSELRLSADDSAQEFLLIPLPDEFTGLQARQELSQTLFHAALDRAFDQAVADEVLDRLALRSFRESIGPAQWHALLVVLVEENLIDEGASTEVVLREAAAFALELERVHPEKWDTFFPGMKPTAPFFQRVREVLDSDGLFKQTQLPGVDWAQIDQPEPRPLPKVEDFPESDSAIRRILHEAERGNDLLAAVRFHLMGDNRSVKYLDRLVDRLQILLGLDAEQVDTWRRACHDLLPRAAELGWPIERRLLYELQRACLAVERMSYSVDVVEWAVTFGRQPIVRPLPRTKWLDATRRLRSALSYAHRLETAFGGYHDLTAKLESASRWVERKAREVLRPELHSVLLDVGLVPHTTVERISYEKLVEELLDAACSRGFLRMSDLRDAIARNRVKLADLSGVREWLGGDALLQANSRLPFRLDGVYRRGEIYMRMLQRGCSLFFGTRPGRLLTKFVALPFGGAFIFLEGLHHMVEAGEGAINWLSGWNRTVEAFAVIGGGAAGTLAEKSALGESWVNAYSIGSIGLILLLLIHIRRFRSLVLHATKFVLVKLSRTIWNSPVIRLLVKNVMTRFLRRNLLIPLVAGAIIAIAYNLLVRDWTSAGIAGFGVALFMGSFFRTPFGRSMEDRVDESIARVWRVVSVNFLIGVLTWVLHFFQAIFEAIDRAIYAVDEWLRFQEGDARFSLWFKAVFGALWFAFTYLFRFAWTLLVEPQINPIKHFPVVTVSHKMLLPLIPSLAKQFGLPEKTMGTIVFGIPGIFGFLVWELKENWKLYRSNAAPLLRPVVVGSHGEKVRALLRPGFHSGVVPKTFAKLRKATRSDSARKTAKYRDSLEHVGEAILRLADRDFMAYLAQSRRWGDRAIRAGHPILTPNRILLPFHFAEGTASTVIALEERGGWIIASVVEAGPMLEWTEEARAAFADALGGLYKLAGVHAVREQAQKVFGIQAYNFDAKPEGLIVPMPDGSSVFHDYDDGPEIRAPERTLPAEAIVFTDCPLSWSHWTQRWEDDAAGKSPLDNLIPGWTLLSNRVVDS